MLLAVPLRQNSHYGIDLKSENLIEILIIIIIINIHFYCAY